MKSNGRLVFGNLETIANQSQNPEGNGHTRILKYNTFRLLHLLIDDRIEQMHALSHVFLVLFFCTRVRVCQIYLYGAG